MAGLYVDTSSLGRILLEEPDAPVIRAKFTSYDAPWSSELLYIELVRLGRRYDLEAAAEHLLSGLNFVSLGRDEIRRAARLDPCEVRTLDAIHLEAAIRLHDSGTIGAVLTHDRQLRTGCDLHRIPLAL
jgi:predicted nucleic acid-binding protein